MVSPNRCEHKYQITKVESCKWKLLVTSTLHCSPLLRSWEILHLNAALPPSHNCHEILYAGEAVPFLDSESPDLARDILKSVVVLQPLNQHPLPSL
jgi:hypothetical protein